MGVMQDGSPAAEFAWHRKAVTSIEWCPQESSMLAVSGEDDQVTIWDMSVEKDDDAMMDKGDNEVEVPPQLLFIHQVRIFTHVRMVQAITCHC